MTDITIRFSVEQQRLLAQLQASQRNVARTTRQMNRNVESVTRSFSRLGQAAAAIFTARQFVDFTRNSADALDQITQIRNLLRSAGVPAEQLDAAMQGIVESADRTRTDFASTGSLIARIARTGRVLNLSFEQTQLIADAFNASLQLSGSSVKEATAATIQFGQALSSGRLQGDELRSILENNSFFAQAFAAELGVSTGELREMGAEGLLTSETLARISLQLAPSILSQFQEINTTFGQAGQLIGQRVTVALENVNQLVRRILGDVGELARTFGDRLASAINTVVRVIDVLRENFDNVREVITVFATGLTVTLLPAILRVSAAMAGFIARVLLVPTAIGFIVTTAVRAIDDIRDLFNGLGLVIGGIVRSIANTIAAPFRIVIAAIIDAFTITINSIISKVNGLSSVLNSAFAAVGSSIRIPELELFDVDATIGQIGEIADQYNTATEEIAEGTAQIQSGYDGIVETGGAIISDAIELGRRLNEAFDTPIREGTVGSVVTGTGLNTEALSLGSEDFFENLLTAGEAAASNAGVSMGTALSEAFSQTLANRRDSFDIGSFLAEGLDAAAQQSEAAFNLQKAVSIAEAIINTHVGASKAIAQGGVFGPVLAGAVIASGLAQVAAIRSQQYQGLQTGGLVTQGGGFLVGEQGPELVSLPAGSAVTNAQDTAAMRNGGKTFNNIVVNTNVGFGRNSQSTADSVNAATLDVFRQGQIDRSGLSAIPQRRRI